MQAIEYMKTVKEVAAVEDSFFVVSMENVLSNIYEINGNDIFVRIESAKKYTYEEIQEIILNAENYNKINEYTDKIILVAILDKFKYDAPDIEVKELLKRLNTMLDIYNSIVVFINNDGSISYMPEDCKYTIEELQKIINDAKEVK